MTGQQHHLEDVDGQTVTIAEVEDGQVTISRAFVVILSHEIGEAPDDDDLEELEQLRIKLARDDDDELDVRDDDERDDDDEDDERRFTDQ